MRILLLCLIFVACSARSAMDITRELVAPPAAVPGQPLRVAITFWTDSWFNPPPEWPDMTIVNGSLVPGNIPNQLVTKQAAGVSWSGVRMERDLMAWDQGSLQLPQMVLTLESAGQPPKTVSLAALDIPIHWPKGVQQPDRFLPAQTLKLTQTLNLFRAGEDKNLHVGDVVEREVVVKAQGVIPAQIPPILIDLPGASTQRLTPVTQALTQGRDEVIGSQRSEKLRYLPDTSGPLVLPPIQLRWWDTQHQQWQLATLPGKRYDILPARQAGSEKVLRAQSGLAGWLWVMLAGTGVVLLICIWFARHLLLRGICFAALAWRRLWTITSLPELYPQSRRRR
ncbi:MULTISPECIES: oxygen tolerance domain protein [unclassified Pantoea]|uniref:oxygen tolerance domain protein n=2 Tax=Pantoea TaxID=53335 RepID=UPI0024B5FB19|nr:oxygen tolerance domain protein [Pantoea sp. EA-12]MDI9221583.1 oxygen tolerance domain protein [Pantoea sp. EA-12]